MSRTPYRILLLAAMLLCWSAGVQDLPAAQPPDGTEAASRQYAAAVALQNRGLFDLAADEWVKFIETYRKDLRLDRAFHYLGVCYLKSRKFDLARQAFEGVVTSFPRSELLEPSYLYLGLSQYSLAQGGQAAMYQAAIDTLQTLITKYPQGKGLPQALFYQAESYYALGKKLDAVRLYQQFTSQFPEHDLLPDAIYAQGVAEQELDRPAAAGQTFDRFLEKFPENPLVTEVTMRRGETLYAAGQYQAAAERFSQVAGKEGFALADQALLRQAAATAQLQRPREAAELYASLPQRFPKSSLVTAAQLSGGKCYYLAGDYPAARGLLEKIKANDSSAPEALHWIARCLIKENRAPTAAELLEKWLSKAPAGSYRASLELDLADAVYETPATRRKSIALYAAVAEKYPRDAVVPQALYMAGLAALGQGDHATALKHAEEFLRQFAKHDLRPDVGYLRAESLLQLGKPAESSPLFEKLLAEYPKHADAGLWRVRRGLALFLARQFSEAIAWLEDGLKGLPTAELRAEAQYLIGSSHFEQEQFAPAVRALEAALAAAPQWRQADDSLLLLAQAQRQLKQPQKAQQTLARLFKEFPKSRILDRARYRQGEYAYADGDFAAAAKAYQELLETAPQSTLVPHALYGLGWARLGQQDYAAAEKAFGEMLDRFPKEKLAARARYGRALARQQQGQFKPALEDLQAVLSAEVPLSERSEARYVQALCQVGLKEHLVAIDALQTLLKDDPNYAGADKVLYELAWAYRARNKPREAAETFGRLAEKHPQSPLAAESLFHAADFAYEKGDLAVAARGFAAAAEKSSDATLGESALHKLGWSRFRQDEFEPALAAYRAQQQRWPKGPLAADAAFMEAECLMKLQRHEEALAAYGRVQKPRGKDFDVLTLLHGGQAAAQLKQWDRSLQMLTQAAERFAASAHLPEILGEKAWALQNLGRLDEAVDLYREVIAKTDRAAAARAQFMIGEIQFQKKQHDEAIKSFFKVAYGYGHPQWQSNAHFEAGRCFEVLRDQRRAVQQYEELIAKFPDSDKAPAARERLAALKK